MAYGEFKDLSRKKQLLIKFYVVKHLILLKKKKKKNYEYQRGLAALVCFLIKSVLLHTNEQELILMWFLRTNN